MISYRTSQGVSRRGVRDVRSGRRQFLTVAGGTAAALLAAACGGNSNSNRSGAPTTAATRAAAAASTSAPAASASTSAPAAAKATPAAPVSVSSVTYYVGDTAPEQLAWQKKFAADFQAAFPQYRAEAAAIPVIDLYPKLQAALATNSPPEVLFRDSNGDNVAALFNQGLMAPMNDVMDDIYKAIGGKDKFDAAAIDRYTLPTGEVIGMPYVGAPFVWWYRSDLLQQVGLTPPSGHWDWNFLLNAVKATHKPPNVYGFAVALGRNAAVQAFIGALILSNGGHFVSPDLKDVVFDSPEVRESIDLIRELAQYAPPDATTWGYAEEVTALLNGNSMTLYTGRILQSVLNMSPDLVGKISNTLTPYNKDPRSFTGMGSHGVFKGSKNLPGAKELAKFSSRKEQMIGYMLTVPGMFSSAIPAYLADSSYTDDKVLKAYDSKLASTVSEASKSTADFLKEGQGWKLNLKSGTLSGSLILADVVQRVVVGKESTQSAVTWGAGQIRDIMKG